MRKIVLFNISAWFCYPCVGAGISGVPTCTQGTLSSYISDFNSLTGTGCAIGIIDYNDFQFAQLSGSLPANTNIVLTPSGQGFQFSLEDANHNAIPFVANGFDLKFEIVYQFTIDPGPIEDGASLRLDPPVGDVTVSQTYCNDGYLQAGGCIPNVGETLTVTTANPFATITFKNPAQNGGFVTSLFDVNGTNGLASFDSVEGTSHVSGAIVDGTAPEPVSASLALAGILSLGGIAYFKRSKR